MLPKLQLKIIQPQTREQKIPVLIITKALHDLNNIVLLSYR